MYIHRHAVLPEGERQFMKPSPEKDMSTTTCTCSRRWIATGEEPKASGHYSDCKETSAPQPEQDAGEQWTHGINRCYVYDGSGQGVAVAYKVEGAEQIISDHRSAAA